MRGTPCTCVSYDLCASIWPRTLVCSLVPRRVQIHRGVYISICARELLLSPWASLNFQDDEEHPTEVAVGYIDVCTRRRRREYTRVFSVVGSWASIKFARVRDCVLACTPTRPFVLGIRWSCLCASRDTSQSIPICFVFPHVRYIPRISMIFAWKQIYLACYLSTSAPSILWGSAHPVYICVCVFLSRPRSLVPLDSVRCNQISMSEPLVRVTVFPALLSRLIRRVSDR